MAHVNKDDVNKDDVNKDDANKDDATKRPKCPICGKPVDASFRPFCSKRCADVDLHRWFSGVYAVPVAEDEEEDERRDDGGETEH